MMALRLVPIFMSALLLAAHFSRADNAPMVAVSLVAPALLLLKRPWVPRVLQIALVLGALEWLRTLISIAHQRQSSGEPWARMAVILGVVALITALSALAFQSKSVRRRFALSETDEDILGE